MQLGAELRIAVEQVFKLWQGSYICNAGLVAFIMTVASDIMYVIAVGQRWVCARVCARLIRFLIRWGGFWRTVDLMRLGTC